MSFSSLAAESVLNDETDCVAVELPPPISDRAALVGATGFPGKPEKLETPLSLFSA